MSEEKKKKTLRLSPCPAHDIERTTSWLENMALDGLFLTEDGFFAGFGIFEKGTPKKVRYRLNAANKSTSMWSDNMGKPDEEELSLIEDSGWRYVANRGDFNIYMTEDVSAGEINTDPYVQSIAINKIRKNRVSSLISLLFWILLWPLFRIRFCIVMTAVTIGTWLTLFGVLLIIWEIYLSASKVVYFSKLQKRLENGDSLDYKKNWKRTAFVNKVMPFLSWLLIILWIVLLLIAKEADDERKIDIADYDGEIPFATMEDLGKGVFVPSSWNFDYMNKIKVNSDLLAPTIISFDQTGSVELPDGRLLEGGLSVDYYETISPWLAREIARELRSYDKKNNHKYYDDIDCPELDADAVYAYTALFPTVVIVDGCKVIHVTFYQTSPTYDMPLSEWAEIFCQSIK